MKIAFINTKFSIGGAAHIAYELYQAMQKIGHQSYFMYGRGQGFKDDQNALNDNQAYLISHKNTILSNYAYSRVIGYDKFSYRPGLNQLKRIIEQVDVIHLHNLHGYVWNPLQLIDLLPENKKILWTLHDLWLITGRCAYPYLCKGYIDFCSKCQFKSNYPRSLLHFPRNFLKLKKKKLKKLWKKISFVTPSQWAKSIIESSYLYNSLGPTHINVIHNAVDEKIFYPKDNVKQIKEQLKIPDHKKIILFVSEMIGDNRKGIQYVLQLINDFKQYQEILFIAIGKKNEQLSPGNLIQAGYIKDKNILANYYAIADLFLLPSLDDNYPTTALESVNCHTPVIGFKVGGIPEIIKQGKNGFLVSRGDIHAMKNLILKSLAGYKFNFSNSHLLDKKQFVNQYLDLYQTER